MISLSPGSLCDVCAEEYGPHNYPHSIPCGHILCLDCCNNILQKTSPRLTPCCPFCRETFTSDAIRLIRIDFGAASLASPKRGTVEANSLARDESSDDDVLLLNPGTLKSRHDVRRLETKVAKVASKKCSVEEVTSLHKELQEWLMLDTKHDEQASSLHLSAALLRAILVNHLAHSEATKLAKSVEANLKKQLDDSESERKALEAELHKTRAQLQAQQELQGSRVQANRSSVRAAAPTLQVPAKPTSAGSISSLQNGLTSPPRPQSTTYFSHSSASSASSGTRSGATSPTSPTRTTYTPSPLARAPGLHARSQSVAPHIRSMTPAAASVRSAMPPHHSTPEPTPTKNFRVTSPPPPLPGKMSRSPSGSADEKEKERERHAARVQLIQRWIPDANATSTSPPSGKPDYFMSAAGIHRSASTIPRRKTPAPVNY